MPILQMKLMPKVVTSRYVLSTMAQNCSVKIWASHAPMLFLGWYEDSLARQCVPNVRRWRSYSLSKGAPSFRREFQFEGNKVWSILLLFCSVGAHVHRWLPLSTLPRAVLCPDRGFPLFVLAVNQVWAEEKKTGTREQWRLSDKGRRTVIAKWMEIA